MTNRNRNRNQDPGPNPDPDKYTRVDTKEGSYYRRKRGTVKPALLNEVFQKNADSITLCSPAARRMVTKLQYDLRGLYTGRQIGRFTALLNKALLEKGVADFSFFGNYEFQPDHPLERLLIAHYQCHQKDGVMEVQIPIVEGGVKKNSPLLTEYYSIWCCCMAMQRHMMG